MDASRAIVRKMLSEAVDERLSPEQTWFIFDLLVVGHEQYDVAKRAVKLFGDIATARDWYRRAKNLELMPPPTPGTLRIYHSILRGYDELTPREMVSSILNKGLIASKGRAYRHVSGYEFGGIWVQTKEPRNTNVVWVAADIPEEHVDPGFVRDDERSEQPQVNTVSMDVPSEWIAAVQGMPTEWYEANPQAPA